MSQAYSLDSNLYLDRLGNLNLVCLWPRRCLGDFPPRQLDPQPVPIPVSYQKEYHRDLLTRLFDRFVPADSIGDQPFAN